VPKKRRKPLKNNRKSRKGKQRLTFFRRLVLGVKISLAITAVMAVTVFFILVHDLLTQSDYFKARSITIGGMQRLTKAQVARQAGVHSGINVLSANITLARKRLLAHPWIAEAEVSRQIPDGLSIVIREHTALAAVNFGAKYLMNKRGEIFKVWDSSDPENLPVISGLNRSDLIVYGSTEAPDDYRSESFQAVMRVLQLGGKKGSILPNGDVKQIDVDRQIGLTIHAFDPGQTINLGFSDYVSKYNMLSRLFSYLKRNRSISDFERIDLNNLKRIVVNPVNRQTGHLKSDTTAES
jgi:cell division protein FtsQ